MNSRMRKHAALAVVTLAAAGALTLAACTETPAASSDAPAIQNQSKSEESMTNERNGGYATISEDEAVAMMSENSATLVDVRTAREYADGHIPEPSTYPSKPSAPSNPPAFKAWTKTPPSSSTAGPACAANTLRTCFSTWVTSTCSTWAASSIGTAKRWPEPSQAASQATRSRICRLGGPCVSRRKRHVDRYGQPLR